MSVRPRTALLGSLACLIGLVVTGLLAYVSSGAHVRDADALEGFVDLNGPRLTPVLDRVVHLADPQPYGVFGVALVLVALLRRRYRVAAVLPVLLLGSAVTTQLLKHALAQPRVAGWLGPEQIGAASWPSGHATAAMTLALCAVLVAAPRWRPPVAVAGGLFALAVSYAVLILHWHFPSDVIGGYLCAGVWVGLGVAFLQREPTSRAELRPGGPVALNGVALGLGGAAVIAVLAGVFDHPRTLAHYLADRPSFALSGIAIAVLAALLAGALARGARDPHAG